MIGATWLETAKKYLPWVIIILLLLFAVWYAEHRSQERSKSGLLSIIHGQSDSILRFQNDLHQQVAEKTLIQASLAQLKMAYPETLKKLESRFKARENDIRAYLTADFEARGKGVTTVRSTKVKGDSAGQKIALSGNQFSKEFETQDEYLTYSGTIRDSTLTYNYIYKDSVNFIVVGKKKWLFGKRRYYVDGALSNPAARITNISGTEITDLREKRFTLGPAIIWSPFTPTYPIIGIGLQYSLVKF